MELGSLKSAVAILTKFLQDTPKRQNSFPKPTTCSPDTAILSKYFDLL